MILSKANSSLLLKNSFTLTWKHWSRSPAMGIFALFVLYPPAISPTLPKLKQSAYTIPTGDSEKLCFITLVTAHGSTLWQA